MPSVTNAGRKDITVNIGSLKPRLMKVCKEQDTTITEVVKNLVRKWVQAKERERQREAKESRESKAVGQTSTKSTPKKGSVGGKTVKGQPSK